MKKQIFLVIILISVVSLGYLWSTEGNKIREIKTVINIDAPPAKVWQTLTDIEKWAEWNPIVNQSSGSVALGSKLKITMRNEDGNDANSYEAMITELDEQKSFRWHGKMLSELLMSNDKVIELEEIDSGTRLIHRETFSGIFVLLFWGKLNEHVPTMLNSMNEALKLTIENSRT